MIRLFANVLQSFNTQYSVIWVSKIGILRV